MWILYAFGTLEVKMSCYKSWPAKTLHFWWLEPNVWWEISQICREYIKPIRQMSDEPWKFFAFTVACQAWGGDPQQTEHCPLAQTNYCMPLWRWLTTENFYATHIWSFNIKFNQFQYHHVHDTLMQLHMYNSVNQNLPWPKKSDCIHSHTRNSTIILVLPPSFCRLCKQKCGNFIRISNR